MAPDAALPKKSLSLAGSSPYVGATSVFARA